jgi:hypothetical protein
MIPGTRRQFAADQSLPAAFLCCDHVGPLRMAPAPYTLRPALLVRIGAAVLANGAIDNFFGAVMLNSTDVAPPCPCDKVHAPATPVLLHITRRFMDVAAHAAESAPAEMNTRLLADLGAHLSS